MEPSPNQETSDHIIPQTVLPQENGVIPQESSPVHPHHKKNIYPIARHLLLVVMVILFLSVLILLIYQNGKSIYDNGL